MEVDIESEFGSSDARMSDARETRRLREEAGLSPEPDSEDDECRTDAYDDAASDDFDAECENFLADAAMGAPVLEQERLDPNCIVPCGVPVAEQKRIAPVCVAGSSKPLPKEQAVMLRQVTRIDRKLLNSRLSHMTEGSYDINGDVVRNKPIPPPWPSTTGAPQCQDWEMAIGERDDPVLSATFCKRNVASAR
eukprot:CAMPEP_0169176952 /NCGR_PEP_ID=MMETSP1015-20121227/66233_1 /TAXON_ID=342587 /ORGANISM="Karlodinium micrum, Strain CCMP2283" /LENGTH=192 /DNA_ID=CAMNT_0009251671 /DNA_START=1 /DNA_END=576 /DNA_ORIENTATION=+